MPKFKIITLNILINDATYERLLNDGEMMQEVLCHAFHEDKEEAHDWLTDHVLDVNPIGSQTIDLKYNDVVGFIEDERLEDLMRTAILS